MISPFMFDDIFEVSDKLTAKYENGIITVDNFYKNFEKLYSVLQNMAVPNWKLSSTSRNFKDYYDCRPVILNGNAGASTSNVPKNDATKRVFEIATKLMEERLSRKGTIRDFNAEFNYFKHINLPKNNNMQFYPHYDSPIAAIIYLDKVCSGGTALYHDLKAGEMKNLEHHNLMYDVSKLKKQIIPAKPNRLVIFPGGTMHGGYIEDHSKYLNDWRINQVMFFG